MTGDDVTDDVTGSGGDLHRKLGLPPRVVDVLRQMSPYAERLTWTVSEDTSTVSLTLVWDLQSASAASSWRRYRWLRPAQRPPPTPVDSDDVGLLQRLRRRLDRHPPPHTGHVTDYQITSGGEETAPAGRAGRGLLRRCVTSLTALRLWKARHSQSSPSLSSDRSHATTTKLQQHRLPVLRQQTVGDDDFTSRARLISSQVSRRTAVETLSRKKNYFPI